MTPSIGDHLIVRKEAGEEVRYRINSLLGSKVNIEDTLTGKRQSRNVTDIYELILSGMATVERAKEQSEKLNKPAAMDFAGLDPAKRDKANRRLLYVEKYLESDVSVKTEKSLSPLIDEVYEKIKNEGKDEWDKKPHPRTVTKWINRYIENDSSVRSLLDGDSRKGNRTPRFDDDLVNKLIDDALSLYLNKEKMSGRSAYRWLESAVEHENYYRDNDNKLPLISYTSFNNRINSISPVELEKAGKTRSGSRSKFIVNKKPPSVNRILERVEVDRTPLDLFVVDNVTGYPLGRPNLTSLIDYRSSSVVGFYVGFEPPSIVSVSYALKHAFTPKTYIKERYPEVVNEWPVFGQIQTLVTDRGKEFESNWLRDACLDLKTVIQWNPAGMPWYKGTVESYFNTINADLLDDKPGKAFSNIFDKGDYDPEKNAVIRFDALLKILHKWVVDIYQKEPHGKNSVIPDVVWRADMDKVVLWPPDPTALDIALGEVLEKQNTAKGIVIEWIQYDSERLAAMRAQSSGKVKVKRIRENLGSIYVFDPKCDEYFPVRAVDFEYANGLTVWMHKVIRKFAKRHVAQNIDRSALVQARDMIRGIVQEEVIKNRSMLIAHKKSLARYSNIGSNLEPGASIVDIMSKTEDNGSSSNVCSEGQEEGIKVHDVMDFDFKLDDSDWE